MKNIIIVTGGAGFVGSNLIKKLLKNTKFKIFSLDNYSTGSKKNHVNNSRVKYLNGNSKDITKIFSKKKNKINSVFHFGEFSRIYQSFKNFDECYLSNTIGSKSVFSFCLQNRIKLIYSATSASLGKNGKDQNLSPYAFTKAKNLELLENLKKWFNFKYDVVFFYNVYGPGQIETGEMATVIGIFENQYRNNIPLTIVRPGSQSRRFTHIDDTIDVCFEAWKKNRNKHYCILHKESHSITKVASMFNHKIKFLPKRDGERFASALTKMSLNNKIIRRYGKKSLKDYVASFIKSTKIKKI